MFDKKPVNTLEVDEVNVELACGEIEKLKAMLEKAQVSIADMKERMEQRITFYQNQKKRLDESQAFLQKLFAAATS